MQRKVLVLNQDFRALTICSVSRAFLLVYMDKAEAVTYFEGWFLRTVSKNYPMPSIIRLNRYVNVPHKSIELNRNNIFKRDRFQCQYCGASRDLTIDHVMPSSRKGATHWTNLVTACRSCNTRKGDLTPEEAGMPLKQKPFKPSFIMFLRHFSGRIHDEWLPYLKVKESK